MKYLTEMKVGKLIDVNSKITTVPALEALERYLRIKEDIARGSMVVAKRIELNLKEYKSSEVDRIAEMINNMKVKKITVMSFGQFNLSVKGFVTEILPQLNSLR